MHKQFQAIITVLSPIIPAIWAAMFARRRRTVAYPNDASGESLWTLVVS
jgi:hypothetical protein